jgi:hypothetical protein
MKAIVVTDQAAGTAGVKLVERPEPQAAILSHLFLSSILGSLCQGCRERGCEICVGGTRPFEA